MQRHRLWFAGGVLVGLCATGLSASAVGALAHASGQSGPAVPKYSAKVVLENARVRVRDVSFPPGVLDTGMHTHEYAHVGVILTPGSLVFTEPGKPAETVQFEAGSVGFREAHVTHQVANPGKTPMRVIEVEIK
jgi:quercetin dioxygenase-like cupin family protein